MQRLLLCSCGQPSERIFLRALIVKYVSDAKYRGEIPVLI